MPVGNGKLTNKRCVLQKIPCYSAAADRIGPIAYDHLLSETFCCAHAIRHRVSKRIDPTTDVLHVEHQHIDGREHCFRWLSSFAVKRVDRQTGFPISCMLTFNHIVLNITAY